MLASLESCQRDTIFLAFFSIDTRTSGDEFVEFSLTTWFKWEWTANWRRHVNSYHTHRLTSHLFEFSFWETFSSPQWKHHRQACDHGLSNNLRLHQRGSETHWDKKKAFKNRFYFTSIPRRIAHTFTEPEFNTNTFHSCSLAFCMTLIFSGWRVAVQLRQLGK